MPLIVDRDAIFSGRARLPPGFRRCSLVLQAAQNLSTLRMVVLESGLRDIERMKLILHSYVEGRGRNRITVQYRAAGVYIGAVDTPNGRMVLR